MQMVGHNHISKYFAFVLVAIKIQAIQNQYDERRAGENRQAFVGVRCNVEDRAFYAVSWIHFSPFTQIA